MSRSVGQPVSVTSDALPGRTFKAANSREEYLARLQAADAVREA